jgi:hypothetical protein
MIFWELLFRCETHEVCDAIQRAYEEFGSVQNLAVHLGVSRIALTRKMKLCGTKMHRRGGQHFRFSRELLPEQWWLMTTDGLANVTGYSRNYAYKLLRAERIKLGLRPESGVACASVPPTNSQAGSLSDASDSPSPSETSEENDE